MGASIRTSLLQKNIEDRVNQAEKEVELASNVHKASQSNLAIALCSLTLTADKKPGERLQALREALRKNTEATQLKEDRL
mmetsp:Transcript_34107/g.42171  ORF Transcript_34107/g.42171 Transcript_34107/m.42171 type:complete len:80 (+) Transcript_34107:910-1149(+)